MTTPSGDKQHRQADHKAAARSGSGGNGHAWRGEEVEEPRDGRDAEDGATRAEGNAPITVREAEERDDEEATDVREPGRPAKTRDVTADDVEAKRQEAAEAHDPKSRPPRPRTL